MKYSIYWALLPVILVSCYPNANPRNNQTVSAYVPIYSSSSDINNIGIEPAKKTIDAGKIYVYGNYIFQVDQYKGIHVIDNTNKSNPSKISFLRIPVCNDISIKGNYLYANNYTNLLVFDISNIASPVLLKKVENAFPATNQKYPPVTGCYFQCVDDSKGVVIGWELKNIDSANCMR